MYKLLIICGPTATGKTELGIHLAKGFNGEIVSVDSRQVYRGMDIATGKDLPASFKFQISSFKFRGRTTGYYLFDNVPVWMLDIVRPTEQFTVADYTAIASRVIRDIWKRGKLPILVGGTGFYIKALVDGINTLNIPPNPKLREAYAGKTVAELFDIFFHLDPEKASSLNDSEKKNKLRLIRRIEIAQFGKAIGDSTNQYIESKYDVLMIGLTMPRDLLKGKIEERIDGWIRGGAEDEVMRLLGAGIGWEMQSMNALGYRQWKPYFEKRSTRDEVVKKWKQEEWQYARRQMTWFKRDKRIKWFDVSREAWRQKVEEIVENWYNGKVKSQMSNVKSQNT